MVGQRERLRPPRTSLSFAEITAKYVGSPYKLGGWSRGEGYDCISLILSILQEYNFTSPYLKAIKESYVDLWIKDHETAKDILSELFMKLGKEIMPCFAFVKDIMIVKDIKTGIRTICIHAGNDLMLGSFTNTGVALANIRMYDFMKVCRWAIQ